MDSISDVSDTRRQFLLYLLSAGAFASIPGCGSSTVVRTAGIPTELPPGRSIFEFDGDATVNGAAVTLQTLIGEGDVVETAANSYIIFVVNKDAFILRSNGKMTFPVPAPAAVVPPSAFSLDRGKAL